VIGDLVRARAAVSVVFGVCGAAFSTWLARVPAVQERAGLATGQLAAGFSASRRVWLSRWGRPVR